jgi:hypothetical protein
MLSCLLLWLRHSSRQLLCPASRFVQSSFITLHYVAFVNQAHVHYVWVICSIRILGRLKIGLVNNHKLHSLPSQAHSTSFRFIQSSFTQQAAGHPLPLLCSPALSFGLRAVMFFAHRVVGRHTSGSFQQSAHPSKKTRQPLFGACLFPDHMLSLQSLPHSSHRTLSFLFRAPCSHPSSCSRSHFVPLRSPLAARKTERGHRTANAHQVNSR